jgi:hypothetical protein
MGVEEEWNPITLDSHRRVGQGSGASRRSWNQINGATGKEQLPQPARVRQVGVDDASLQQTLDHEPVWPADKTPFEDIGKEGLFKKAGPGNR